MKLLRFRTVHGAQFPAKLAKYAEDLITQKNDFQVAMVKQIAVGVDRIGMSVFLNCSLCSSSDYKSR